MKKNYVSFPNVHSLPIVCQLERVNPTYERYILGPILVNRHMSRVSKNDVSHFDFSSLHLKFSKFLLFLINLFGGRKDCNKLFKVICVQNCCRLRSFSVYRESRIFLSNRKEKNILLYRFYVLRNPLQWRNTSKRCSSDLKLLLFPNFYFS